MKKLLCLIAVFALTAPVMADPNVLVTCTDEGNGVVLVSYQVLVEDGVDPGLMRGIALDITVDNGCQIDVIKDYDAQGEPVPADSTQIPDGYSIYMGSVIFAVDPNLVANFGDPVAPGTYPDTAGQLGDSGITVEMGSLYAEGDPAPPAAGDLFRLELSDPTSAGSCTMTIAANTTRGGCVMEDGASANVVSVGCLVEFEEDCWDFDCFDCGDTNGDCVLTYGIDVQAIINAWPATGGIYDRCADLNKDGVITFGGDVQILINKWPANPQPGHNPGCIDCGACTPI